MKTITINLYSVTGQHLIPMLRLECHQSLCHQSLELGFMETDEGDLYPITLKIHLYWGNPNKPEDIILNHIRNRLIPSLKEVIWRTNGDDSYYGYTPDYTQQVYQFLYLTREAKLLPTKEFLRIQREIKNELDNLYGEDPSSYPKYNPDKYREFAHICSLRITEE